MPTHSEIFDSIYRDNFWLKGSGPGSREEVTRHYRDWLQDFLGVNRIVSVVDLGCGDWQIARHMDWVGIDYVGIDASAVVLEETQKFARPGVRFLHASGVSDPLPPADLLIVKDVLQHWSNADILAFLPQLEKFRFALITNGFSPPRAARMNMDIETGDCRAVDPTLAPFRLPGCFVFRFQADEMKRVFLWTNPASGR